MFAPTTKPPPIIIPFVERFSKRKISCEIRIRRWYRKKYQTNCGDIVVVMEWGEGGITRIDGFLRAFLSYLDLLLTFFLLIFWPNFRFLNDNLKNAERKTWPPPPSRNTISIFFSFCKNRKNHALLPCNKISGFLKTDEWNLNTWYKISDFRYLTEKNWVSIMVGGGA